MMFFGGVTGDGDTIRSIVEHPIPLALYGWIGYQIWAVMRAKKDFDKDKSGFLDKKEFMHYLRSEMLPILFSFWVIPGGILWLKPFWNTIMPGIEFFHHSYIIAGCTAGFIQWYVKKKYG